MNFVQYRGEGGGGRKTFGGWRGGSVANLRGAGV